MELVGQYQRPSGTSVVTFRFPWYVTIALFMLTGITIIVVGVITLAHRELSNPFSVVRDLFGEDARQVALARGFSCQDTGLVSEPLTTCVQHNTDKIFSRVYVRLSGNIANDISFSLRENTFTLGDLTLLWGKPEMRRYCETVVYFRSDRHIISKVSPTRTGRINYFAPVISVSFTQGGTPNWERVMLNDAIHNCQ